MQTTAEQREELEQLAEAATRGPWDFDRDWVVAEGGKVGVCEYSTEEDAAFIAAANPQVVKALLADFEEVVRDRNALSAKVTELRNLVNEEAVSAGRLKQLQADYDLMVRRNKPNRAQRGTETAAAHGAAQPPAPEVTP